MRKLAYIMMFEIALFDEGVTISVVTLKELRGTIQEID